MSQSLRTNTLFNQIIREEYTKELLKKRVSINEASGTLYTTSHVDPVYAKNPKAPWTGKAAIAAGILKSLGAQYYSLGFNDDGLELTVYTKGIPQDRLQFYSDGSVYSSDTAGTDMGWKLDGSTIQLTEKPGSSEIVGTITKSGSKNNYVQSKSGKAAKAVDDAEKKDAEVYTSGEKIIDRIQLVLDWAGLVPIIGDGLDVVNAVIYAIRGKWWDCLFSAIGIIPVVGSVISLSVKSAMKAIKGIKKVAGGVDDVADAWKLLISNKILKKQDIADLNAGFKLLAKKSMTVRSWFLRNGAQTLGKQANDVLMDGLDSFDNMLKSVIDVNAKQAGKYGSDLATTLASNSANTAAAGATRVGNAFFARASKQEIADALGDVGKTAADATVMNVGWLRRNAGRLTGPIRKIFASSKVSKEVGDVIKHGLEAKFKKQFANPQNLTVLFKTSMNNPQIVKELSEQWGKKFAKDSALGQSKTMEHILQTKDARVIQNLLEKASKGDVSAFVNVKPDTLIDWYNSAQKTLLDSAMDMTNPNMFFSTFINDEFNIVKTYLGRHLASDKSLVSQYITSLVPSAQSFAKRVDIYMSECQDALEAMGIQNDTSQNGIFVTWLTDTLTKTFPSIFDPEKNQGVRNVIAPWKAVGKQAAGAVGYDTEAGYDPESVKGGIYTK